MRRLRNYSKKILSFTLLILISEPSSAAATVRIAAANATLMTLKPLRKMIIAAFVVLCLKACVYERDVCRSYYS